MTTPDAPTDTPAARFVSAARKAVATFVFATVGVIIGASVPVLDIDAETWQLAAATGIGAVLNLVYRWSEAVVHERRHPLPPPPPPSE